MRDRHVNLPGRVSLFAQKFLVAFENRQVLVYAPVSGWDQAYLLWTFRNFRSLPQNVLNPRQQQLMASLYGNVSEHSVRELSDAFVVGRIEDFDPAKLVTISISRKGTTPASSPPQKKPADVVVLDRDQRSHTPFTLGRMTLKLGAGALVAVIAILAWYQLGAQPVLHSAMTDSHPASATVATLTPEESGPPAKDLQPAAVESPAELITTPPAVAAVPNTNAFPPTSTPTTSAPEIAVRTPAVSAKPPQNVVAAIAASTERVGKSHRSVPTPPVVEQASTDQPLIRISGRPRKLIYPVCPETGSRGKVSLQAVVENDGKVSRVRVLTGDRVLAKAAVEAVRQWRYEPFLDANSHVERETSITVSFISNEVVAVSFPEPAPLSR
jgi:periplasmic protein TonB